jgi:CspA family cold shock protein
MRGTLKWFSKVKRYGFVQPSDGSADVFLHYSELERAGYHDGLIDGVRLEFDLGSHGARPCAQNIRLRRD